MSEGAREKELIEPIDSLSGLKIRQTSHLVPGPVICDDSFDKTHAESTAFATLHQPSQRLMVSSIFTPLIGRRLFPHGHFAVNSGQSGRRWR